jgi:DNA-binding transcriptional LysR family regulator
MKPNDAVLAQTLLPPSGNGTRRHTHMNVRHLEIFWAVMHSGSQHDAARLLGLSQPAVSKLLRYTESRIGIPLFRRSKGRLHPTPEAEVFFQAVDDIFSRLESAERLARDLQRHLTGRLTVASIASFGTSLVSEALGAFVQRHPLLKVGLKVLTPAEVVERVANSQADIGLTFGPVDTEAVDAHELRMVPLVCAVPKDHRLASKATITAQDLQGERLISATKRPLWAELIEQAFADAGLSADVSLECTQSDLAFAMAAANAGIALMPAVPASHAVGARVVIRPFRPEIEVAALAVTHKNRPLPQTVAMLIDQLRATAERIIWF